MIQLFLDPPGAPGTPQLVETTEDTITITWSKPRHDGGSPITGYVIEKRLISEDKWIKAVALHIPDTTYKLVPTCNKILGCFIREVRPFLGDTSRKINVSHVDCLSWPQPIINIATYVTTKDGTVSNIPKFRIYVADLTIRLHTKTVAGLQSCKIKILFIQMYHEKDLSKKKCTERN